MENQPVPVGTNTPSPFPSPGAITPTARMSAAANAATSFYTFGLTPVPTVAGEPGPAVDLHGWLQVVSAAVIARHWQEHPDHEVSCILGNEHIVFACSTPEAETAMNEIEARCQLQSQFVLKTKSGSNRFYRLPQGATVRKGLSVLLVGHIRILATQELVPLPPTAGMKVTVMDASNFRELAEASPELLDEVHLHNARLTQQEASLAAVGDSKALSIPVEVGPAVDLESSSIDSAGIARGSEVGASLLSQFSLLDRAEEVERHVQEQRPFLGELALIGQATVWYASPGTGKTLIVLYLLTAAITCGVVRPDRVFYLNMDDNAKGLAEKLQIATEYRFHMLADGHRDFDVRAFLETMMQMVEEDKVDGAIVILDTLKKFVNLMDKGRSSNFTRLARQFVMKGGTIVALAHANKHPNAQGKVIYSGTADIVDDFDCAYTIDLISRDTDANECVIEFTNIKRRGDVALSAGYGYALERQLSYAALLSSVRPFEADALRPIKADLEAEDDRLVIDAVLACLAEGIETKMLLASAAAQRAGVGKHTAVAVIERYTGDEPRKHRWRYIVRARGAKVYQALPPPTPNSAP